MVKTLIRLGIRPLQADLSLRWAHMSIRWFCHDAAQINTILMAELFLEMTQWKNFISAFYVCLGTSFRYHKSLVYSNCQNDRKCFFSFFFFFVYVPGMRFITYMFVYHFGRIWYFASIICKKGSFGNTAYSIQSLKTADAVLLSLFMSDNGICDIPHAA